MKIALPSFMIDQGKSGIGTYLISLVDGLQNIDKDNSYEIFLSESDSPFLNISKSNFSKCQTSNIIQKPIPNIIWHNTALPIYGQLNKFDLVHIPSFRRIPLIKAATTVCTIHDLAPLKIPNKYDKARTFYHKKILSNLIHNCDHIITVSESTKFDIIEQLNYPQEKITVIYPGVNHTLFHPIDKASAKDHIAKKYNIIDPFFTYVSRLEHPAKNHVKLIEAFEHYKKNTNGHEKLLIIGTDWKDSEIIKRAASASKYSEDIIFLGFIPTEDLPYFYSACSLMIYPSLYEGFGLPLIEAYACGAPVICSNTSSLKEIIQSPDDTFDPTNPIDISQCISRCLEKSGNSNTIQKENCSYALNFNWNKTARDTLDVYHSLRYNVSLE